MLKNKAFSLAEALITLMIVSIILAATAPVLTKKKVRKDTNLIWHVDNSVHMAITPLDGKDIILGSYDNSDKQNGIVVRGKLYFKDTKGNVIGWIAEDGTNSFSKTEVFDMESILQRQQKIDEAISMLSSMLQSQKQSQQPTQWYPDNKSQKNKNNRATRNTQKENEEMQLQLDELVRILNSQTK